MNAAIRFQLSSRAGFSAVPVNGLQGPDFLFYSRPSHSGRTQAIPATDALIQRCLAAGG